MRRITNISQLPQEVQDNLAREQARMQALIDNLPNWAVVSNRVDNISSLAEAKDYLKKLSRVVYWLAKNQED